MLSKSFTQNFWPWFLLTDHFPFPARIFVFFFFDFPPRFLPGIWDFCPKTPTFPWLSSWFSARDFPIDFPTLLLWGWFSHLQRPSLRGRDILFLPTLASPSASRRRKRRDSPRKSLQGLRLRLFFSFSHNPKVAWFKSRLRNQESNPCICRRNDYARVISLPFQHLQSNAK